MGNAPPAAPVDAAQPGRVVHGLSPRPEGGVPVPEGDSSTIPQDCPPMHPPVTELVIILYPLPTNSAEDPERTILNSNVSAFYRRRLD